MNARTFNIFADLKLPHILRIVRRAADIGGFLNAALCARFDPSYILVGRAWGKLGDQKLVMIGWHPQSFKNDADQSTKDILTILVRVPDLGVERVMQVSMRDILDDENQRKIAESIGNRILDAHRHGNVDLDTGEKGDDPDITADQLCDHANRIAEQNDDPMKKFTREN